ncbi:MAG: site-specific DNA-methyltransferase [Lentisphaeria bacterium]|nr:site-specific DNA-methyltransferase [Lentisphaeria bacterium]
MEKMKFETVDGTVRNVDKIAEMFPQVVTEVLGEDGKLKRAVKWDVLKELLSGDYVEGGECYEFTWPGKRAAIAEAAKPIRKTLRPCKEESKNWDTTENLYIEGDNLEVLKLLQESYLGKVKMIYIDPPYNTGNDFVYKDNFTKDKDTSEDELGLFDEETDNRTMSGELFHNTESNGRFHSDWCSMIYPRLQIAKDLLADDGIIFISIDEHEIVNIQKICDEVFGAGNNLGTIVWDKRNPKGEVAGVAQQHEYIVVYCKNFSEFNSANYFFRKKEHAQQMLSKAEALVKHYDLEKAGDLFKQWLKEHKNDFSGGELAYCFLDEHGQVYRPVSMAAPDKPEIRSHRPLIHPVTNKPCPVPAKGWRYPDKSMDELLRKNLILFGKDENTQPNRKYLLLDNIQERVPSLLYFGGSDTTEGLLFDNPKPLYIISRLVESLGVKSEDIILDFFSGSATAAHAVMKLNAEDSGNRKFIMVQLPEVCEAGSEAAKAGYKNICEIGKERIRRAGEKIKEEAGLAAADLDIGFRVFKVADGNMKDVYYSAGDYSQDMLDSLVCNIKEDRTDLDLLYGCLLEWGVELSLPHTSETIDNVTVHTVNNGDLIACFDANIPESAIRTIAKRQPLRAVFRDSSFASAPQKINVEEIFKLLSPTTTVKVI